MITRHSLVVQSVGRVLMAVVGFAAEVRADPVKDYLQTVPSYSQSPAASETGRLVWERSVGDRNEVWLGQVTGGSPTLLASYDDERLVRHITISADGRWVGYTYEREVLPDGRISNVGNKADPIRNEIIVHDLIAKKRQVIAEGVFDAGQMQIVGDKLYYVVGSDLYQTALKADEALLKPERILTIRGSLGEVVFSPDKKRLAFVSDRSTHSLVGIFDLDKKTVKYLNPEISFDFAPRWSPDGSKLVFTRDSYPITAHFSDPINGMPWSIMLAEVSNNEVKRLWSADKGLGSATNAGGGMSLPVWRVDTSISGPPASWIDDDNLLVQWEKTGFNSLYRLPIATAKPERLITLDAEVLQGTVDRERGQIFFFANADLPERYDLWSLDLKSQKARMRLEGDIIWDYGPPTITANGCAVLFDGSMTTPHVATSVCGDRVARLQDIPKGFPVSAMVEPTIVTFPAADGKMVRGVLYRPRGSSAMPGPALVYSRGGPTTIYTVSATGYAPAHAAVLRGYTLLSVNYRGSSGYGAAFRDTPDAGPVNATDALDTIGAARYLATLPEVDPKRIGAYGGSYGGFLTAMAIAREPKLFAAGVSMVGVHDWVMEFELDAGRRLPVRGSAGIKLEDQYLAASPNTHLEGWRTPMLFIMGDEDTIGWTAQAVELGYQLRRRGVHVEAMVDPGGTHQYDVLEYTIGRHTRLLDFFERFLGKP